MKRDTFNESQVGESFLHAYAFHMCDAGPGEEYAARVHCTHGDEREAGVFDLPSEAKKAAKAIAKRAIAETGSKSWIWCVDRRELTSAKYLHWGDTTERWSNCGGHEDMRT